MKRFFLASIVLFLASLGVGGFLVWPSYQELSDLRSQVGEKEARLQAKENTLVQLKELQRELLTYEKELKKIDATLPEDPQLPSLYDLVQSLSSLSGLLMQSISSSTAEPGEETESLVKTTTLIVQLSGSYQGLKDFLSRAHASARVLNVQAVNIGSSEKEGEGLGIEVQLEAYSY